MLCPACNSKTPRHGCRYCGPDAQTIETCDTCGKPYSNPGDTCEDCLSSDLGSVDRQPEA